MKERKKNRRNESKIRKAIYVRGEREIYRKSNYEREEKETTDSKESKTRKKSKTKNVRRKRERELAREKWQV